MDTSPIQDLKPIREDEAQPHTINFRLPLQGDFLGTEPRAILFGHFVANAYTPRGEVWLPSRRWAIILGNKEGVQKRSRI